LDRGFAAERRVSTFAVAGSVVVNVLKKKSTLVTQGIDKQNSKLRVGCLADFHLKK